MVKQMASKLKDARLPDPEKFVIEEEDEEVTEPVVTEFIVKATLPEKALVSADFRCHTFDRRESEDSSICGRLKMLDAVSVGSHAPGMICQLCRSKAQI